MVNEIHKGCGGNITTIHYADMSCTTTRKCDKCGESKTTSSDFLTRIEKVDL